MTLLVLCAAFISLISVAALAQDITLSLETPGLEDRAAQQPQTSYSSSRTAQQKQVQTTTANVQKADQVTLGRVGTVVSEKATIYSKRSSKGRVFSVCSASTPLAIIGEIGEWYGVLMIDGSTGWIPKKHVKLLNYQLVAPKSTPERFRNMTSRGGYDRGANSEFGHQVLQEAYKYMGVPYVWGGTSDSGLDCSGFVQKVNKALGVKLPRTAREQATVGEAVGYTELQAGDRLYFACKGSTVDHCGIYIGENMFIHSSKGRNGVAIDDLTKPFWAQSLVGARRS